MSLFNKVTKTFQWGQNTVRMETGEIARQSSGAVLLDMDGTVVLATVVAKSDAKAGQDFFPLTVNYQEKTFAAGKIPGGYFKREGRPTEKETLVSRLIDRPIRPLFVKGFKNETQVIITVLQHDMENDPDIVGLVAACDIILCSDNAQLGMPEIDRSKLERIDIRTSQLITPLFEYSGACSGCGATFQDKDEAGFAYVTGKQIENYDKKVEVTETGTVLTAGDGIARVYGLEGAMAGELIEFPGELMGMVLNLEEDNVGAAIFGNDQQFTRAVTQAGQAVDEDSW